METLRRLAGELVTVSPEVCSAGAREELRLASSSLIGTIYARWQHLDGLAYKLSRAREAEVVQECLEQAARLEEEQLDDVTAVFLSPASPPRPACIVLAVGHECSKELSSALQPHEWLLVDEKVIEGTQRSRKALVNSHSMKFVGDAARSRHAQNAADAADAHNRDEDKEFA